jgi:osmotically-inducible protein OsmY
MKRPVELQRDVMEELRHDLHADAARIGVTVSEAVVTLVGVVECCGARLAAQRAAERVPGVKGLANDLEVKGYGTTRCTDGEIAKAALNAIAASMGTSDHGVKVTVREGCVVLRGEVDRPPQKIEAGGARFYG